MTYCCNNFHDTAACLYKWLIAWVGYFTISIKHIILQQIEFGSQFASFYYKAKM